MRSIEVMRLHAADDPLLEGFWLPLYRDDSAFPANERIPEAEHRRALADPDRHLLVALVEESRPAALARYDVCRHPDVGPFGYLMYLATAPECRSQGIGSAFLAAIATIGRESPAPPIALMLEVEDPGEARRVSAERHTEALARIRFYAREPQGFRFLHGVRYIQCVPGHPGVPMRLAFKPLARPITPDEALAIARHLFDDDVQPEGPLALIAPDADGNLE